MPGLLAYAAPLALVFPFLGQAASMAGVAAAERAGTSVSSSPDFEEPPEAPFSPANPDALPIVNPLDALHAGQIWQQFRIEQRVIIRITPQQESNRNSLLARLPQRGLTTQFEEREMDRCLPVSRISGVQTGNGNRLLLFLNDNRIVSLNLERACRAREFYSGFYIERPEDGQLCVDRDELQSRSGARCEVERMRQLVAVED